MPRRGAGETLRPRLPLSAMKLEPGGEFGPLEIRLANWRNLDNPKTSLLPCLVVVSLLKRIRGTEQMGGY